MENRSVNLMDHKLYIFCQNGLCNTQTHLAFFPQGCGLHGFLVVAILGTVFLRGLSDTLLTLGAGAAHGVVA